MVVVNFLLFLLLIFIVNSNSVTIKKLEDAYDVLTNKKKRDFTKKRYCVICLKIETQDSICNNCIDKHQINEHDIRDSLDLTIQKCRDLNKQNKEILINFNKEFFLQNVYSLNQVLNRCKNGRDFELLVQNVFESVGIQVRELTKPTSDGGKDLIVEFDGELAYVECKRYTTQNVGSESVRKLAGAMLENNIKKGMIITTSGFTADARQIRNLPIELYTWPNFVKKFVDTNLVNKTKYSSICLNIHCESIVVHDIQEAPPICPICQLEQKDFHISLLQGARLLTFAGSGSEKQILDGSKWRERTCPLCSGVLTEIKPGRYSKNKFKKFIGCSNYPKCRYSRPKW